MLYESLRELLACPRCKGELASTPGGELRCPACAASYPVRLGIPVFFRHERDTGAAPSGDVADGCGLSVLLIEPAGDGQGRAFTERLHAILPDLADSFELIAVTSRDDAARLEEIASMGASALVCRERGYGKALAAGIAAARGEFIVTVSENPRQPDIVRVLWNRRDRGDAVIASRYAPGGGAQMGLARQLLSRLLNTVFPALLHLPLRDISSGLRLYRSAALKGMPIEGADYDALAEVLVRLYSDGADILEIPWRYRVSPSAMKGGHLLRFGVAYLRTLFSMWRLRNSLLCADYDDRAYDSLIPLQRWWQRTRVRVVLDMLEGREDGILDVGCGSSKIIQALPGAVGLDAMFNRLKFLRRTNALLVQGDICALPFRDESFDAVVCSQVIEHLPKSPAVMGELTRVLRKGGILILGTPDYGTLSWRVIEALYCRVLPSAYGDDHVAHYTRAEVEALLESHGFAVERVRYVAGAELIVRARRRREASSREH